MSLTAMSFVALSITLLTLTVIVPVFGDVILSIVASVVDALDVALNLAILTLPSVSSDKSRSCAWPFVSIRAKSDSVIA